MKKTNALYLFIFILILNSCGIRYNERNAEGFGGGNWTVKIPSSTNVSNQNHGSNVGKINEGNVDSISSNSVALSFEKKLGFSAENMQFRSLSEIETKTNHKKSLKKMPKWNAIKQILRLNKEHKIHKNQNSIIPDSSSNWPKWVFFCTAVLAFIASIVIMSIPNTMGLNIVGGVLVWLLGGVYILASALEDFAQEKEIVYQIGFYGTFFMPLTIFIFIYPLILVFLLMWIIGAIFDI